MHKRKLTILALIVLLLGISIGGVYTYWVGSVSNPNEYTDTQDITIGTGKDITTELNVTKALVSQGKKLVPHGKINVSAGGENANVEEFIAKYKIKWEESGTENVISSNDNITGTLKAEVTSKTIDGTGYGDLVTVTVNPTNSKITAAGNEVEVEVKVTLTEPSTKEIYQAIAGGTIKVGLKFSIKQ